MCVCSVFTVHVNRNLIIYIEEDEQKKNAESLTGHAIEINTFIDENNEIKISNKKWIKWVYWHHTHKYSTEICLKRNVWHNDTQNYR